MSGSKAQKRRRDNLFKQHPYCHWCKCKLSHPEIVKQKQTQPGDMATIDHLRNRTDFNRTEANTENQTRTVLSCKKCNEERGRISEQALPIEDLRARSKRHGVKTGE